MANFKYHGRLITAATKQMAVRKIIAVGLTSGEKRLEASRLDGATDELEVYTGMFLENGKLSAPQLQGLYDAVCVLTAFGQRGKKFIDLAKSDVMKAKGDEAKKVLDVLDGKKPAGSSVTAASKKDPREAECAETAKYVLSYVKENAAKDAQLSEPKKVNKSDDDFYVLYDLNVSGKKCKLYAGETDYSITEKELGTFEGSTDLPGAANSDLDEFVEKVKKLGKKKGSRVKASASIMRRRVRALSEPKDYEGIIQDFKKYFKELDLSEQFGGGEYIYRSENGLDVYSNDLVEKGDTVSKTYWTTLYMLNGGGYLRPTANDFFAEQVEECEYAFDDEYGKGSFEKLSNSGEPKDFEKLNEFEENYFNERMINGETCEVSFEAIFDEEEGKVHFELNLPYEERLIDNDYPLTADGLNKLKSDVKNA